MYIIFHPEILMTKTFIQNLNHITNQDVLSNDSSCLIFNIVMLHLSFVFGNQEKQYDIDIKTSFKVCHHYTHIYYPSTEKWRMFANGFV